jgi:hypothetical protein
MRKGLPIAGTLLAILVTCGCSGGGFKDDGIPSSDKATAASANAIAVSVGGDFDKLTPDQKKMFINLAGGGEKMARNMVNFMAHPPVRGAGGAAGQGAPPASGPHPPGSGG